LSPFHLASPGEALSGNASVPGALVLLGATGVLLVLAVIAFDRRDLVAP